MVENKSIIINDDNYLKYQKNNIIIIEGISNVNIDFNYSEIKTPVYIKECVIKNMYLNSTWFRKGFVLENCIVLNDINHEIGGHNYSEIHIHNNIFLGFFDFFDCHFFERMTVNNNIFIKGTNLIGNTCKGYKNIFDKGLELYENIGRLNEEN